MNSTTPAGVVTISEQVDATLIGFLVQELSGVPDHRKPRGVRYRLSEMLVCAVLAKLAGAQSAADIARWVANHTDALHALGLPVFSYKTALRLIRGIDAEALDKALCRTVGRQAVARAVQSGVLVVAVDGKELTGSVRRDGPAVRLVSVWDHRTGVVLAQVQVSDKGGEQGGLPELLAQVMGQLNAQTGWSGCLVVTLDANFCGDPALNAITSVGGLWVVTVKGNRPSAKRALTSLDWEESPVLSRVDQAHARRTVIQVRSTGFPDPDSAPVPGARAALRVHRESERPGARTGKTKKKTSKPKPRTPSTRTTRRGGAYVNTTETTYVVTSYEPPDHPLQTLYSYNRGHWGVEVKSHWCRDVIFGEDGSQLRAGTGPRFMAAVNNFSIGLIRLTEGINANIRAATQKAAARISYAVSLLAPLRI